VIYIKGKLVFLFRCSDATNPLLFSATVVVAPASVKIAADESLEIHARIVSLLLAVVDRFVLRRSSVTLQPVSGAEYGVLHRAPAAFPLVSSPLVVDESGTQAGLRHPSIRPLHGVEPLFRFPLVIVFYVRQFRAARPHPRGPRYLFLFLDSWHFLFWRCVCVLLGITQHPHIFFLDFVFPSGEEK
jgi:hypothetical protein